MNSARWCLTNITRNLCENICNSWSLLNFSSFWNQMFDADSSNIAEQQEKHTFDGHSDNLTLLKTTILTLRSSISCNHTIFISDAFVFLIFAVDRSQEEFLLKNVRFRKKIKHCFALRQNPLYKLHRLSRHNVNLTIVRRKPGKVQIELPVELTEDRSLLSEIHEEVRLN